MPEANPPLAIELLVSALDGLGVGLLAEDQDVKIAYANTALLELFGIPGSPADLLGADCNEAAEQSARLFCDPRGFLDRIEMLRGSDRAVYEDELRLLDGRILSRDSIPVTSGGGVVRCWVYRDVTSKTVLRERLTRSEALARGVLDASFDSVVLIDDQGAIVSFSSAAEAEFGWTQDQVLGLRLADTIVPLEHRKAHSEALERYSGHRQSQVVGHRIEVEAVRKNGTRFPVELMIREVVAGERKYFAGFLRNLTQQQEYERRLRQQVEQLTSLQQQSASMSDLAGMLHAAQHGLDVAALIEQFGPKIFLESSGSFHTLEEGEYRLRAAWGQWKAKPAFAPLACWAVRRARQHTSKATDSVRCTHLDRASGVASCVPIEVSGQITALLTLVLPDTNSVSNDLSVAPGLGELIQLSLTNIQLREELRRETFIDPLTGLHNRRYLRQIDERLAERARQSDEPLAVVVIDIDHFKKLNDRHGHQAGDRALRAVAKELLQSYRVNDMVCRYGGEEFVALLLGADVAQAEERAEAVRQRISALTVLHQGQPIERITVSQGIAVGTGSAVRVSDLIRQADEALYAAKAAGRNTWRTAEDTAAERE